MKKRVAVAVVAVIGITAAGWYLLKGQPAATPPQPASTDQQVVRLDPNEHDFFDVDFAQKMVVHHQQGIEIADAALAVSADQNTRAMATDMRKVQSDAEAQYKSWLDEWGEEYTNLADFPQMDGHDMYPSYPGVVSAAKLGKLKTASNTDVNVQFLELMTEHHKGGIQSGDMSRKLQYKKLIDFKDKVFADYAVELQNMEKM